MNKINVFILAGGIGERLAPITEHIPKPLLPILGKPVLQTVIERVLALNPDKIGINLYHKKEEIENWINSSDFRERVVLFPEDPVLGTGGALKNASALLQEGAFLVYNSDILSDIELKELLDFHLSSGNLVTLALIDCPEFNTVCIDKDGFLKGVGTHSEKRLTFTGIAVYSSEFLRFIPQGISHIIDAWLRAVKEGCKVGSLDVSGSYWKDIGTPPGYAGAVFDALKREGETVYIHPSVRGCNHIDIDGLVVFERGCMFSKDALLRNCIVLPESCIEGSHHESIIGSDFKIKLSGEDMFGQFPLLIGTGGSERKYLRVKNGEKTKILMQCKEDDYDFIRHLQYTQFFKKYSIPVPELIEADPQRKTATFEDLGDVSLYNYLKCQRDEKDIETIYRKVLDVATLIHTTDISECPFLIFDYTHLRWETGYFIEWFIKGIRGIKLKNPSLLNEEFHSLATKVDSFPKTIIHRDFQSQNIMLKDGKIRILDYQGARVGPSAYDLASLLWDPYYRLDDALRERLIDYYVYERKEKDSGFDIEDFKRTLLPSRLQRHMQALGAYGFLSSMKCKNYFLKHVPEGLRLLKEDVSLTRKDYPKLYNLVMNL